MAAAKKAPVVKTYLQFAEKDIDVADVVEKCKEDWKSQFGGRGKRVHDLNVYLKHEEGRAYYLANDKDSGSVEL